MAQAVLPGAKITLSYPLYACDFDPQDANRLVVGGGGGPGRSGVGNKIVSLRPSLSSPSATPSPRAPSPPTPQLPSSLPGYPPNPQNPN